MPWNSERVRRDVLAESRLARGDGDAARVGGVAVLVRAHRVGAGREPEEDVAAVGGGGGLRERRAAGVDHHRGAPDRLARGVVEDGAADARRMVVRRSAARSGRTRVVELEGPQVQLELLAEQFRVERLDLEADHALEPAGQRPPRIGVRRGVEFHVGLECGLRAGDAVDHEGEAGARVSRHREPAEELRSVRRRRDVRFRTGVPAVVIVVADPDAGGGIEGHAGRHAGGDLALDAELDLEDRRHDHRHRADHDRDHGERALVDGRLLGARVRLLAAQREIGGRVQLLGVVGAQLSPDQPMSQSQ